MEKYVKYLRKSRFDRDYAEASVEETLKRHDAILDKLARDRGYCVAKTYYEVVSGESIAARPEIQKMLAEVSAGVYTGVLVVDLERLARGNGADQAYISQVFQFSGTKIVTPLKVYDPNNEFDEEYFEFGLFMSRREYKTINRRLVRGRDSSAAEGKYISGIAPYGYTRVKLAGEKGYTLAPCPEEAETVRNIFDLFLEHTGTKRIANVLNDRQVPTRHGGLWSCSTVSNILANPVYMGKIRRGWSRQVRTFEDGQVKKHTKRHKNLSDYQIFDGLHPPLITEETFLRAQELRTARQPAPRVKTDHPLQNAFAGLLFCSVCGKRIARTTLSRERGQTARLRCVNSRNCHNGTANYDLVEREILSALENWLEGYRVKIDTAGFGEEIAAQKAVLEHCSETLSRLSAQMDNAFDLVEQGLYTPDLFRERRDKLLQTMEAEKARQAAAAEALEALESGEAAQSALVPQTETLLASYGQMTGQERNTLLKAVLQKIEYRKGADGTVEIDLYPRLPRL